MVSSNERRVRVVRSFLLVLVGGARAAADKLEMSWGQKSNFRHWDELASGIVGPEQEGTLGMVGRERELVLLREFLALEGPARGIVLVGSPGVGKTTLWEAGVAAAQERGMLVLVSRPSDGAQVPIWWATLKALRGATPTQPRITFASNLATRFNLSAPWRGGFIHLTTGTSTPRQGLPKTLLPLRPSPGRNEATPRAGRRLRGHLAAAPRKNPEAMRSWGADQLC